MADRRAQILALLDSRHDHLPEPLRRDHASAGFVHRTLAPAVCPTCDGVDPHCPVCRGTGEVEIKRTRDPMSLAEGSVVPQVMRGVSPYGLASTVKLGHVSARDAELMRLADQTAAALGTELDLVAQANLHPYGWERARRAMYARFDYRPLDVALERLAGYAVHPHSERGLALLDLWLPDPLRAPRLDPKETTVANLQARGRQADPRALAQRDQRVLELLADGTTYAEIAALVGLSVRQLRRIANRPRDEAA